MKRKNNAIGRLMLGLAALLLCLWACDREEALDVPDSRLPTTTFLGAPEWKHTQPAYRRMSEERPVPPFAHLAQAQLPDNMVAILTMVKDKQGNDVELVTLTYAVERTNDRGEPGLYGWTAAFDNRTQQLYFAAELQQGVYRTLLQGDRPMCYQEFMDSWLAYSWPGAPNPSGWLSGMWDWVTKLFMCRDEDRDGYGGVLNECNVMGYMKRNDDFGGGWSGFPDYGYFPGCTENLLGGGGGGGGGYPSGDPKDDPKNDPNDPCGHANKMNSDSGFKDRLQPLADELKNGALLENGYMLNYQGNMIYPETRTSRGLTYAGGDVLKYKPFVENIRIHPSNKYSSICFSEKDINALINIYTEGHIAYGTESDFRSIVISHLGVSVLHIADLSMFESFIEKTRDYNYWVSFVSDLFGDISNSTSVDEAIAGFLGVLSKYNTGLSFGFSSGISNIGNLSLQIKELNPSTKKVENRNCN